MGLCAWKTRPPQTHIEKISQYVKYLVSQIFRSSPGIKSVADITEKEKTLVIILITLTIVGVIEISCSFRLVLEENVDRELHQMSG